MIRRNQKILNAINIITDIILLYAAYEISMRLRFGIFGGIDSLELLQGGFSQYPWLFSLFIVFGFYLIGLYENFRFKRVSAENTKIVAMNAFGTLLLTALLYMRHVVDFSRWALVILYVLSCVLVIAKRMIVRGILRYARSQNHNLKHVVIVGDGFLAHQFANDIKTQPELGLTIDGYFGAAKPDLINRLGAFEDMESILSGMDIDSIVIALEPHEIEHLKAVLAAAEKEGIRVELIPFYNDIIPAHPSIDNIGKSKLIDLRATPLDSIGWAFAKRIIDIVGAFVLIIVTSPLMIICAVGVKLSSPGPIFFKQERIGKGKRPFKMLKFRSMRVNDSQDKAWSTNADPRKTRFGSFIRKYSIDEIPQFFNVLVGDMSLVGPRPEIPFHVNHFKEDVPRYLVRQQVRPGITGWAQVHGLRGDTSIENRVEYDIWYIENWSLGLDIKILWDTVFKGKFKNEEII